MKRTGFAIMAATAAIVIMAMGVSTAVPAASTPAKATYTEWTAEKEIFVPMRDGVYLSTDVLLPKGASGKLSTIPVRTPYDKQTLEAKTLESFYKKFLNKSYAFVLLMQQGEVYQIRLTNMVTGNRFPTGHRIRLDVSSSNFPAFERTPNTGGYNYDETTWTVAENNIHHSAARPSHVVMPILPIES